MGFFLSGLCERWGKWNNLRAHCRKLILNHIDYATKSSFVGFLSGGDDSKGGLFPLTHYLTLPTSWLDLLAEDNLVQCWEAFPRFFIDRVHQIWADLGGSLGTNHLLDVSEMFSCQFSMDSFRLLLLTKVDRTHGVANYIFSYPGLLNTSRN